MSRRDRRSPRSSGKAKIGRMSNATFHATTCAAAIKAMTRAEALYRQADLERRDDRRAELKAQALANVGHAVRFGLDCLADNKQDVAEMVEIWEAARREDAAEVDEAVA